MKKLLYISIILACTACSYQSEEADLVIHNAKIYAVDEGFNVYKAMAIKDGKILELGAEREILNKYNAKETFNAGAYTIYPGFIDAHCHFYKYGLSLQQVNLVGTGSWEEVLEKCVWHHQQHPTEWITGRGWDQNDWANNAFPDNTELDSLFPNNPVLIRRVDGHAAIANTIALQQAGITTETNIEGGIVEVKNGQLTGLLVDNAVDAVLDIIPEPSQEESIRALMNAQDNCFAVGLTTVDDAGLDKEDIELIDQLHQQNTLKMRVYAMVSDTKENLEHYLGTGPIKTERLNVRSFKFYADGALGSRGACLLEPYADVDSTHYGLMLSEEAHFKQCAQDLFDQGFQMNTHCIGDSANRLMLDIYGSVLGGTNDYRWRIEHAQVIAPNDFEKFAAYTIIPSVQSTHCTSDMYWAGDRVGPERVKGAYAYKKLLQQNGLVALGTDFPVEDIAPLKTFYAAVARKDAKGYPGGGFQKEHALTRQEALKGMTIWAALSNFEEYEKGSLEPGKYADFVMLEKDILEIPEEELLQVKVIATYVNGESVYNANAIQ